PDIHPQTGRAGEPGDDLQGGAAVEFRHFRPDGKPRQAWAFERLICTSALHAGLACDLYPHDSSGMQFRGWIAAPAPLNTTSRFSPFEEILMTETLTHFIGGKQISAPGALESLNPSNTGEVIAKFPDGSVEDVNDAVAAAR